MNPNLDKKVRITIWNEFRHERKNEAVKKIYPQGMHTVIAKGLKKQSQFLIPYLRFKIKTATLDEPSHGLTDEVINSTDVLIWWGHIAHNEVKDEIVKKVQNRILEGMGLIVLHSGHYSKIFRVLLGTNCSLKWREAAEKERLWNIQPSHLITEGIGEYIELPNTEMYGERFDIPDPDEIIFISWFEGGEVFRSGITFRRGAGKIFYFRPGHETYPIYYNSQIIKVITNACKWAAPNIFIQDSCPNVSNPLEKISAVSVDFGKTGIIQKM
ncbi:trehalose utilization protein ThuA [bacterium Unc6]|uniref:ThuA-like domain-containing protein n=1 Tax=Psychracetigena formicireducens TaxID=2986056 RepID=A0A9E2BI37_PSYF1|nr:trehalose utilization protein ThuA [bacterium Unc6]MBT9146011.1 hypothetical protein [Candidatus Psychracetigena formicireducens]